MWICPHETYAGPSSDRTIELRKRDDTAGLRAPAPSGEGRVAAEPHTSMPDVANIRLGGLACSELHPVPRIGDLIMLDLARVGRAAEHRGEGRVADLRLIALRLRMRRMVEAPMRWPSLSSSPWILKYPSVGSPAPSASPRRRGRRRSVAVRPGGVGPSAAYEAAMPAQDRGR